MLLAAYLLHGQDSCQPSQWAMLLATKLPVGSRHTKTLFSLWNKSKLHPKMLTEARVQCCSFTLAERVSVASLCIGLMHLIITVIINIRSRIFFIVQLLYHVHAMWFCLPPVFCKRKCVAWWLTRLADLLLTDLAKNPKHLAKIKVARFPGSPPVLWPQIQNKGETLVLTHTWYRKSTVTVKHCLVKSF